MTELLFSNERGWVGGPTVRHGLCFAAGFLASLKTSQPKQEQLSLALEDQGWRECFPFDSTRKPALPLYGAGRFAGHIIDHTVHVLHLINDPGDGARQESHVIVLEGRRHPVDGRNSA